MYISREYLQWSRVEPEWGILDHQAPNIPFILFWSRSPTSLATSVSFGLYKCQTFKGPGPSFSDGRTKVSTHETWEWSLGPKDIRFGWYINTYIIIYLYSRLPRTPNGPPGMAGDPRFDVWVAAFQGRERRAEGPRVTRRRGRGRSGQLCRAGALWPTSFGGVSTTFGRGS